MDSFEHDNTVVVCLSGAVKVSDPVQRVQSGSRSQMFDSNLPSMLAVVSAKEPRRLAFPLTLRHSLIRNIVIASP